MKKPNCCEKCLVTTPRFIVGCKNIVCECHTTQTTPSEEWKDSYKGKLWSTAVQKCFESPFVEVAIQHMLQTIDAIHQKELAATRTAAYKEGLQAALEALPEVTKQSESEEGAHYEIAQKEYKYFAAEAIARLQD